ncbi:GNAT family N-acetyltransferase [Thalassobellus citreus]|uniref:GNAT family N-acetyltransferase n=1 Tax=Thalassobellus citreus TaxID=3367752 RepID=UPI0037B3BCDB
MITTKLIEQTEIRNLGIDSTYEILPFLKQLNPDKAESIIKTRLWEMMTYDNYQLFGFYKYGRLKGILGGWTLTKIYSGKQLEIDNFIIDDTVQSKGYGKQFLDLVQNWAKQNNYHSIELDVYTENRRAHKFYYSKGYEIFGYHMIKAL